MAKRPNIVIFNPDQMRADALHHLGNAAAITPNFDRLIAEDAVSFQNAFCQNPVCVPSRCSFVTGLYPHVHGHRTMNHMLHDQHSTIFKELKDAGYYVWMNDRNDMIPAQIENYYDQHADFVHKSPKGILSKRKVVKTAVQRGEPGDKDYYSFYRGEILTEDQAVHKTYDDESVEAAIDYIDQKQDDDQPFCIFLGLLYPHPPYQVEEPYFSAIQRELLPKRIQNVDFGENMPSILRTIRENQNMDQYTEEEWDELRACYLAMCMKVDMQFGLLCDALKRNGLYDDTDIYVFSDHGDFTGDYGITEKCQNTFQDCLTNIPFIVKPNRTVAVDAGVSDSMVELVDFYATAMTLSGVNPDHTHFGKSLLPVLENRTIDLRRFVTCEGGRLQEELHCSEVPTGIPDKNYPYYPRMRAQHNPVSHTKATMLRSKQYKYVRRLYESDEFYDLENDAQELKNLIDEPAYQNLIFDFKDDMLMWYQETCDAVPLKEDFRFDIRKAWEGLRCNPKLSQEQVRLFDEKIRTEQFSGTDFQTIIQFIQGE